LYNNSEIVSESPLIFYQENEVIIQYVNDLTIIINPVFVLSITKNGLSAGTKNGRVGKVTEWTFVIFPP
jgi:hypothetical protein